ncbi:hypothetical protein [Haloarcula sp. Atlit-120R]|uniref:hypothetical protein n=1 Tax=Haloarcula sp. Atlit-120R TaxID=2282135 RepID=UPI00268DBDC1
MELNAPPPMTRWQALDELQQAGVSVFVSMSPTYPTMSEDDVHELLSYVRALGAGRRFWQLPILGCLEPIADTVPALFVTGTVRRARAPALCREVETLANTYFRRQAIFAWTDHCHTLHPSPFHA